MSLLSRYYVKENIQKRLLENNMQEQDATNEEFGSLYREIDNIKDNIIKATGNAEEVVFGFFGISAYNS